MTEETRNCQNCKNQFTIEQEDFNFYKKMDVPPPTFCPECRLTRRLAYRNERALYKRPCDLCKKERIFMYPKDTPFPVYCYECWWSDSWDPKKHARDYDFSRNFFEQWQELFNEVPRAGTVKQGLSADSEYTNRVTDQRGCYLTFGSTRSENCRYGVFFNDSKDCMDCYNAQKSEGCYESVDCFKCFNISYSQECLECTDSYFLYNCRNCQNCFGCVNLRNSSYCIFNKQYSKEDYQKKLGQFQLGNSIIFEGVKNQFEELKKKNIVPWAVSHHGNNATGNWIENGRDVHRSFMCREVENCRYCFGVFSAKDIMDHTFWCNGSERTYECANVGNQCAGMKFSNECWSQAIEGEYSMNCHNSHDLFGCDGLRNAEYCILNKEYSKEEYEKMIERIRNQMDEMPYKDKAGNVYRYGEFFPIELSPHGYNETLAQEFFPITKEEAMEKGYSWKEPEVKDYKITVDSEDLPEEIDETLLKETIGCAHKGECNEQCTKAFRMIPDELNFYKKMNLPLPKLCPNCRHYGRMKKRNPLKLWSRKCQCAGTESDNRVYQNTIFHGHHGEGHCPNEFETSYSSDRPEIVYCEECYNAEVV